MQSLELWEYDRIRLKATRQRTQEGQHPTPRLRGMEITPFLAPRNNLHTHLESVSLNPTSTGRASLREFIGYMDRKTRSTQRQATTVLGVRFVYEHRGGREVASLVRSIISVMLVCRGNDPTSIANTMHLFTKRILLTRTNAVQRFCLQQQC